MSEVGNRMAAWLRGAAVLVVAVCASIPMSSAQSIAGKAPKCNGEDPTIVGSDNPNGAEVILGTKNRDVIQARGGPDVVRARGGQDVICAGSGTDKVFGGGGSDWINGGPDEYGRSDHLNELFGGRGDDVLDGGADEDYLYGGPGDDRMTGTSRAGDEFYPGPGNDLLIGGGRVALNEQEHYESDLAVYRGSKGPIRANVEKGVVRAQGEDVLRGIRSVEGSNFDDVLVGDAWHNILVGWGGDDVIRSRGTKDSCSTPGGDTKCGPDVIWAGRGDDQIFGSLDSRAWVAFRSQTKPLQIELEQGSAVGEGEDELHNVSMVAINEDLLEYRWYCPEPPTQSTVVGDDDRNIFQVRCAADFLLQGLGGDDAITATFATATVEGGEGDDFLAGELGETTLSGGPDDDDLRADDSEANDTLDGGEGLSDECRGDAGDAFVNCEFKP